MEKSEELVTYAIVGNHRVSGDLFYLVFPFESNSCWSTGLIDVSSGVSESDLIELLNRDFDRISTISSIVAAESIKIIKMSSNFTLNSDGRVS